jgi:hypothetical protein
VVRVGNRSELEPELSGTASQFEPPEMHMIQRGQDGNSHLFGSQRPAIKQNQMYTRRHWDCAIYGVEKLADFQDSDAVGDIRR